MRIAERHLRSIVRSIIKENYSSVPSKEGIYHSSKKHVAGNLWKLLGCYGPMKGSKHESTYAYRSGIYYGGFDWNNHDSYIDAMTEDPALNSGDAYELVEEIIFELGLKSDLRELRRQFDGIESYNRLSRQYLQSTQTVSGNPPNTPPTQAIAASPDGGTRFRWII